MFLQESAILQGPLSNSARNATTPKNQAIYIGNNDVIFVSLVHNHRLRANYLQPDVKDVCCVWFYYQNLGAGQALDLMKPQPSSVLVSSLSLSKLPPNIMRAQRGSVVEDAYNIMRFSNDVMRPFG